MYNRNSNTKPQYPSKTVKMTRCELCGRQIDESSAFCVIKGPKKHFYCSNEEYLGGKEYVEKRNKYDEGIMKAVKRIVCYDQDKRVDYGFDDGLYNTLVVDWSKYASYEKIYYYLELEEDKLRGLLMKKEIPKVATRLKYLSAVLVNNIVDYKVKAINHENTRENVYSAGMDEALYTYKPNLEPRKSIRRSMEDLEDKYGN